MGLPHGEELKCALKREIEIERDPFVEGEIEYTRKSYCVWLVVRKRSDSKHRQRDAGSLRRERRRVPTREIQDYWPVDRAGLRLVIIIARLTCTITLIPSEAVGFGGQTQGAGEVAFLQQYRTVERERGKAVPEELTVTTQNTI